MRANSSKRRGAARRAAALGAFAGVLAAVLAAPAAADSAETLAGLGGPPAWKPTESGIGPSAEQGRFVALGGQYLNLGYACVSCHGLDGTGDPSGAFPRLAGQSAWYLYSTLNDFATGVRPSDVMTPIARTLGERALENVAAYYASLPAEPYPTSLPVANDKPAIAGRDIALKGYPGQGVLPCVGCHGVNGEGRAPLFPFIGGQYEPYLVQQLHKFKSGQRGDRANVMTTIASGLSNDDIDAVSTYFASLMPRQLTPSTRTAASPSPESATGLPRGIVHLGAAMNPRPEEGRTVLPRTAQAPRQ
jgi:cytochrome c553